MHSVSNSYLCLIFLLRKLISYQDVNKALEPQVKQRLKHGVTSLKLYLLNATERDGEGGKNIINISLSALRSILFKTQIGRLGLQMASSQGKKLVNFRWWMRICLFMNMERTKMRNK